MSKLESALTTDRISSMSAMDAIWGRRSVRSYGPQAVSIPAVHTLLDAAIQAPTAVHEEPWAFAVIQDRKILKRLSDKAKELLRDKPREDHFPGASKPSFMLPDNVFYDAGTLIVIYGKPLGPYVTADCWLAAENLMLAAYAMGLGSCVIGLSIPALNTREWKAELKVPAEMTAYAPIIVGAPAGETQSPGRQNPHILVWKADLAA